MKTTLAILIAVALAGCATPPPPRMLSLADSDREITLATGQVFAIALPANPTTGFQWSEKKAGGDALVSLDGPSYKQYPDTQQMTGVGGVTTWKFSAVKPGRQTLCFEYVRPWETGVPPARVARYSIVVR